MRVAETDTNKRFTICVNDREHKDFKIACIENDREMAEVLRGFMRDYVKKSKKKWNRLRIGNKLFHI